MLCYVKDGKEILQDIVNRGYKTSIIREKKLLSESTLQNLRKNKMVDSATLGKVCDLLGCQPEDLVMNVTNEDDQKYYKSILKSVK